MAAITYIEDDFNYVSERGESIDVLISNYFNYVAKGDTSLINIVNTSNQVCTHFKFTSTNTKIILMLSEDSINFIDENNTPVNYSYSVKLSIENGIVYYYLIITNLDEIDPNKDYYIIINNLKDNIGEDIVPPPILHISPAAEMIDFSVHRNSLGEKISSIGMFGDASNVSEQNTLTINGIIDGGIKYITEEPTEDNPFGIKFCYLKTAPETMYNGWLYIVEEGTGPSPGPEPVEGGQYYVVKAEKDDN